MPIYPIKGYTITIKEKNPTTIVERFPERTVSIRRFKDETVVFGLADITDNHLTDQNRIDYMLKSTNIPIKDTNYTVL